MFLTLPLHLLFVFTANSVLRYIQLTTLVILVASL